MEKRKWPWKKKSSERGGGESESSESISSHSERFSDEQVHLSSIFFLRLTCLKMMQLMDCYIHS